MGRAGQLSAALREKVSGDTLGRLSVGYATSRCPTVFPRGTNRQGMKREDQSRWDGGCISLSSCPGGIPRSTYSGTMKIRGPKQREKNSPIGCATSKLTNSIRIALERQAPRKNEGLGRLTFLLRHMSPRCACTIETALPRSNRYRTVQVAPAGLVYVSISRAFVFIPREKRPRRHRTWIIISYAFSAMVASNRKDSSR